MATAHKENFLEQAGHLFIFETPKCICTKDIIHDEHDNPTYALNVRELNNNTTITYAFKANNGLVVINKKNGTIDKKTNPITDLLALKLDYTEKSSDELVEYINKYGFFFSCNGQRRTHIEYSELCSIIKKVQALCALISSIGSNGPKYSEMYRRIMELDRANTDTMQPGSLVTKCQTFYDLLCDPEVIPEKITPKHMIEQRPYETKDKYGYDIYDIHDTFINTDKTLSYVSKEYVNQSPEEDSDDENGKIYYLYCNYLDYSNNIRRLVDFHFNLLISLKNSNISSFEKTDLAKGIISYLKNHNLDRLSVFDDKYKNFLTLIARHTIKAELDTVISSIHPVYNIEKMAPDWEINDLLTGLYLALLYINPKYELYRTCDRINCNNRFLVKSTNSKKLYCSQECCNAAAQQRYRHKRLQTTAEAIASIDTQPENTP